ncbi:transposable element Tcb2 transposase [Trichonephila clavipes]|nr:transposable element Tcb2 transposase [Trichonephila clavipes]
MSLATVAAARVLKGQKAGRPGVGEEMLYETFPSVGLARPSTYESTIAQCSPSGCTSCLGKRAQRLECKRLESRFRLLNANERLRIWRQAHEAMGPACRVGTVQGHVASIMAWGVFLWHCLGSLVRVQTYLSAIRYVELLADLLHPLILFCYPHGMKGHHTALMNLTELWIALANIWQVIPMERFQKLVESMSRRVTAVMKARGGPTRY